jgi:hypothetical protein
MTNHCSHNAGLWRLSSVPNWVVAISALGACITGVLSYLKSRRNADALRVIHILVNRRLSDTVSRVEQLTEIIRAARIEVPPEPADKKAAT